MKRLFNLFLAVVMIFSFTCIQVYAANGTGGSGNIDGGGGSMGDATSHGSWNPGNEGVRVTVVRASDHAVVTTPFDLTNKTPSAGIYHFGKVSKIQYNNGTGLSPVQGGYSYLTGEDAPKDSVKALSLLKRSAGRGNQFAQYRLGKLLLQGEDAPKDVKAAIRWLTAAAEQGNQYAQYALGKLYLLGKEVPKDRSSAIKWFQLAADQGNEYAQYFLKHMDDRLGQAPVAAVISLFHHLANIFQEQNQPPPSGGVRVAVDRKLLRKIKAKKIAQGHKADDHEPEMQL